MKIQIVAAVLLSSMVASAQTSVPASAKPVANVPMSSRAADMAIATWPDGDVMGKGAPRWIYDEGVVLEGVTDVWYATANPKYYNYVKHCMDVLVAKDGSIATYKASENSLDNVLMGRIALMLYGVTQDKRYYLAAKAVRAQLESHPRTDEGGYWHKAIYPHQMWLDGLYMGEPFRAEYAKKFQEPDEFNDIAQQFIWSEKHLRDPKTGLLYHAWDESKALPWSDKQTGLSPEFWSRGMGWYAMALVDVLDSFPENHPKRAELIAILNRLMTGVAAQQDAKTGLWYEVTNKPTGKGNYLEASASAMFVYAMEKGVRMGYLPARYSAVAAKAYAGIQSKFITTDANGTVHMSSIVQGVGLGGKPYRDGSYTYYTTTKVVSDDSKGIGALMMAATEVERAKTARMGLGKTVAVDAWFNSQVRKNAAGQTESFHYKWNDEANSGFAFFGQAFQSYGVKTKTLAQAPTLTALKLAQMYIIVSPDIPGKVDHPNYVTAKDADDVAAWVKQGGVLVLMMNDNTNTDFDHTNLLAAKFGVHFNAVDNNKVPDSKNEDDGKLLIPAGNAIFTPKKIFMKEICSITASGAAKPVMTWQDNTVMTVTKFGKGTVYAVVDPWLYNEYTDGRKLPMEFENYAAAKELVQWLVKQVPPSSRPRQATGVAQ